MTDCFINCSIDPGQRNVLVTFFDKADTGYYTVEVGTAWAKIRRGRRGREDNEASMLQSKVPYLINVKYPLEFEVESKYRLSVPHRGSTEAAAWMRILDRGEPDFSGKSLTIEAEDWERDQ